MLLYFLYSDTGYIRNWKKGHAVIDNYIKRQVKKYVQKLIHQKFDKNPDIYFKLKNIFDKKFIPKIAKMKYIFMNFQTALKHAPEYLDQSSKYNL